MNPVVESADFISKNSQHVKLGTDNEFKKAAEVITPLLKSWKHESWSNFPTHPKNLENLEDKVSWVFLIDTMNYAFWTPDGKPPFTAICDGIKYTGYWSLCASIKRSLEKSKEILSPKFWASSSIDDWKSIFVSDTETECPFIEWRQETISEAGKFVLERYNGSVYEMVKACNRSALKLVELIRSNLKSYRDQCMFNGREVYFLKRAQIFAADLHYAFLGDNGEVAEHCRFDDIEKLTMFADYRVPQTLVYLNILHYDEYLIKKLEDDPHFPSGSQLECEIRGNSIQAVEKLKNFIDFPTNSVLIDFILWSYAKEHTEEMKHIPIHKTKSVFY